MNVSNPSKYVTPTRTGLCTRAWFWRCYIAVLVGAVLGLHWWFS